MRGEKGKYTPLNSHGWYFEYFFSTKGVIWVGWGVIVHCSSPMFDSPLEGIGCEL